MRIVRVQPTRPSYRFLKGKHPNKIIPFSALLEPFEETPIFIPVYIMEEAVESVARILSGISGPGGTDSESLQGCFLKFGDYSTTLLTIVETFVDWVAHLWFIYVWPADCA